MTKNNIKIKLFADGADINGMREMYKAGYISGFTTNPSLMKKAGIKDYEQFALAVLKEITDMPISFEVFSDDFADMEKEARKIATWASNVYIKIPVINSRSESSVPLIKKLSAEGMKLNVTAVFTAKQVEAIVDAVTPGVGCYVSVFAGRLADTGVDPMPLMRETSALCRAKDKVESLWASTREVINIFQAQEAGIDIITAPNDVLKKLPNLGRDPELLSLDTVETFMKDIMSLGYKII